MCPIDVDVRDADWETSAILPLQGLGPLWPSVYILIA